LNRTNTMSTMKGVSSFVKAQPKQHVIKLYQNQGEFYFRAMVPRDKQYKYFWKDAGKIPPNTSYRDGFGIGRCVSTRMQKTATILVELPGIRRFDVRDPLCTMKRRYTKKVQIHDEFELINPGDVVMFKKLPVPKSKLKYYGLHEVIRRAPQWEDYPSWEGTTDGDFHAAGPYDQDRDDEFDLHYRLLRQVDMTKRRKTEAKREGQVQAQAKTEQQKRQWLIAKQSFRLWCDKKGVLTTAKTYQEYLKELGEDAHAIPHYPRSDPEDPTWKQRESKSKQMFQNSRGH